MKSSGLAFVCSIPRLGRRLRRVPLRKGRLGNLYQEKGRQEQFVPSHPVRRMDKIVFDWLFGKKRDSGVTDSHLLSSSSLSPTEQDAMRHAGRCAANAMDAIRQQFVAGVTELEIDALVRDCFCELRIESGTLGLNGFPASCCIGTNEVVTNGVPSANSFVEGDIVSLLIPAKVDGFYAHLAETILVGSVHAEARKLTQTTFDALTAAVNEMKPGCRVADVGRAIVTRAHEFGYGVVREYVGHGIGRKQHIDPSVPSYPNRQSYFDFLEPGTAFTIQPLLTAGGHLVHTDRKDGWTVRTRDQSLAAEFKHTILMTQEGAEVLTATKCGPQPGDSV